MEIKIKKITKITVVILFILSAAIILTACSPEDSGSINADNKSQENPNQKNPDKEMKGDITVIGDSISLGAKSSLEDIIPDCYVDAEVSRSINDGADILQDLQDKDELGEFVIIALGTNGNYDYANQLTKIIDELGSGRRMIFVTPFDGRSNENSKVTKETADWIRELPAQYQYITVADWETLISSQTDILADDTVHLGGQDSIDLYVDMIINALNEASQKPAK